MKERIIRRLKVVRARILALCLLILFAGYLDANSDQKQTITVDVLHGRELIAKGGKNGQYKRH